VQPPHPPGAMDFPLSTMETVFHRDRWKDAYLWKTLKDHGAPVAFASDWPVTDVSVMRGLRAAMLRVPFGPDCGDERLTLMESLCAYTAGGAWAAHLDGLTGTLKTGLAADVVILDADIQAISADSLGNVGVAYTICGGRSTYQRA